MAKPERFIAQCCRICDVDLSSTRRRDRTALICKGADIDHRAGEYLGIGGQHEGHDPRDVVGRDRTPGRGPSNRGIEAIRVATDAAEGDAGKTRRRVG